MLKRLFHLKVWNLNNVKAKTLFSPFLRLFAKFLEEMVLF